MKYSLKTMYNNKQIELFLSEEKYKTIKMKNNKFTTNLIILIVAYLLAIYQVCRASQDTSTRIISIAIVTILCIVIGFIMNKRNQRRDI